MWSFLRQYIWVLDILGVILCAYFLANLAGLYLEGKLEVSKSLGIMQEGEVELPAREFIPQEKYNIIISRNIFDSTPPEEGGAPTESESEEKREVNLTGEAIKTSLGIKVIGVLVIGNGMDSRSSATVSSGKDTDVYAVGEEDGFAPETKITKVAPDRIEFINRDRLEYAEVTVDFGDSIFGRAKDGPLVASGGSSKNKPSVKSDTPGKFTIDQAEVDNALSNLDKLYTEIRAVPNFSGGKISGMKVLSVKRNSIFQKLGLRRGDILKRINGMELDVKKGFQIFSQLKDQKSFTVDLTRRGTPVTLEYEIR